MEKGKLKNNNVHLHEHEYATVKVLLENGYDIELIPPIRIEGVRTPDITMRGVAWEMKAPSGDGKNTIRHIVKKAIHQSENLIIDLRRCKLPQDQVVKELEHHFNLSKRIRRLMIITKTEEILDYSKQ